MRSSLLILCLSYIPYTVAKAIIDKSCIDGRLGQPLKTILEDSKKIASSISIDNTNCQKLFDVIFGNTPQGREDAFNEVKGYISKISDALNGPNDLVITCTDSFIKTRSKGWPWRGKKESFDTRTVPETPMAFRYYSCAEMPSRVACTIEDFNTIIICPPSKKNRYRHLDPRTLDWFQNHPLDNTPMDTIGDSLLGVIFHELLHYANLQVVDLTWSLNGRKGKAYDWAGIYQLSKMNNPIAAAKNADSIMFFALGCTLNAYDWSTGFANT